MRLRETGRRVCALARWFAGGLERDSLWEFCGDQLCTVVHRQAFSCNGRLGNTLIYMDCLTFDSPVNQRVPLWIHGGLDRPLILVKES